MVSSSIISVFYLLTALFLLSSFFVFEKQEKKLNIVVWIPVTILTFMCFNTLVAGIINLVSIPVNLISMGIINLVTGGVICFFSLKKKRFQKYFIRIVDVVAIVLITTVVLVCALQQFGPKLWLNYETSDPAIHMQMAMDILNTQKVSGMFFTSLNNSLIIGVFAPFLQFAKYYKAFVLADIGMFWLSGMMFYSLISHYNKNIFLKVTVLIGTALYMLGYPLNNMIFGFVYLGMGVTLIAYLIFLCRQYTREGIKRTLNIILLMLGCMGLIVCYSLFAPITYIAIALTIIVIYIQKKQFVNRFWHIVGIEFAIFLIPTILGLFYGYFNYFDSSSNLTATSAISMEGYIYRDLFMNFIPFLPFTLYGLISRVKKKKFTEGEIFMLLFSAFTFIMFLMGMKGSVSSYYYFKNYYLIWMLVFYFGIAGISYLLQKSKTAVLSYALVWLFIGTVSFTKADYKVSQRNILFEPEPRSSSLFNLYEFNRVKLKKESNISGEQIQLFEYVTKQCNPMNKNVPLLDGIEGVYWFEAITNQRLEKYYDWKADSIEDYINQLRNCDFIAIAWNSETFLNNQQYFLNLERSYQNAYGFIARMP